MEITNNWRFTLKRNADEYLKSLDKQDPIIKKIEKIQLCKSSEFEYKYYWDADFRKFFSWNFEKTEDIIKYYPDVDLFLKNIYWDKLFENTSKLLDQVLGNLVSKKEKSLYTLSRWSDYEKGNKRYSSWNDHYLRSS